MYVAAEIWPTGRSPEPVIASPFRVAGRSAPLPARAYPVRAGRWPPQQHLGIGNRVAATVRIVTLEAMAEHQYVDPWRKL